MIKLCDNLSTVYPASRPITALVIQTPKCLEA